MSFPNTVARLVSAAGSNNATLVSDKRTKLWRVTGYNAAAAVRYIKLFNLRVLPAPGTDTPFVTISLAPSAAFNIPFDGLTFQTGLGYGLVTGSADSDNTAVTAADIVGMNLLYESP